MRREDDLAVQLFALGDLVAVLDAFRRDKMGGEGRHHLAGLDRVISGVLAVDPSSRPTPATGSPTVRRETKISAVSAESPPEMT